MIEDYYLGLSDMKVKTLLSKIIWELGATEGKSIESGVIISGFVNYSLCDCHQDTSCL